MSLTLEIAAAKENFFDTEKVRQAVDQATLRNLSKIGAFVRTRSRSSIRKRKSASNPGSPPSSHTGLLKDLIFFGLERGSEPNVVIGPVLANRSMRGAKPQAGMTGPQILEDGGDMEIDHHGKLRTVRIEPRPYMKPAFDYVITQELDKIWKDSIR